MWADSESSVVSSKDISNKQSNQRIGSRIILVFDEDGRIDKPPKTQEEGLDQPTQNNRADFN